VQVTPPTNPATPAGPPDEIHRLGAELVAATSADMMTAMLAKDSKIRQLTEQLARAARAYQQLEESSRAATEAHASEVQTNQRHLASLSSRCKKLEEEQTANRGVKSTIEEEVARARQEVVEQAEALFAERQSEFNATLVKQQASLANQAAEAGAALGAKDTEIADLTRRLADAQACQEAANSAHHAEMVKLTRSQAQERAGFQAALRADDAAMDELKRSHAERLAGDKAVLRAKDAEMDELKGRLEDAMAQVNVAAAAAVAPLPEVESWKDDLEWQLEVEEAEEEAEKQRSRANDLEVRVVQLQKRDKELVKRMGELEAHVGIWKQDAENWRYKHETASVEDEIDPDEPCKGRCWHHCPRQQQAGSPNRRKIAPRRRLPTKPTPDTSTSANAGPANVA
jgi:chromosome segregation ATPase